MAKGLLKYIMMFVALVSPFLCYGNDDTASGQEKEDLDVKEIIFHHLGDGYGWEVPFTHNLRIPLPVIVRAQDGSWHAFMSSELAEHSYVVERSGKNYTFALPHEGEYSGKVVEILSDGITQYRPLDFSITKNVLALFISVLVVSLLILSLSRHYKRNHFKAPRRGLGFVELGVEFIYFDVIKPTLGLKARKYAPYLLTCFFFILVMNLLGLIVIFPGGANLTGNIAVTMVLALLTFLMTNIGATKHYWKEILWPDVPIWLKCPLPIMQFIEIFGIFTKPAALCVRLFANMMGGHMIVLTLTVLIFIFTAFGAAAVGGVTVLSVLFSIFMLALDVLVSLIQAYVFTMLSTIFIGMAQEEGHTHLQEDADEQIALDNNSKASTASVNA